MRLSRNIEYHLRKLLILMIYLDSFLRRERWRDRRGNRKGNHKNQVALQRRINLIIKHQFTLTNTKMKLNKPILKKKKKKNNKKITTI